MLDLYILNETISKGLSQDLLSFVSLGSIFSGIFLGKDPIVSLFFFKGLLYGLDFNWDTTELMLTHYNYNMTLQCSIFFSCVSITGIIGIIVLASNLNLTGKKINDIPRQIADNKSDSDNKIQMNLCCSEAKAHGVWNFWSFVYDEKDTNGTHLSRLFNKPLYVKQVRYIDGVGYTGFLFRPSVAIGQGPFAHFNFPGTKVDIDPRVLQELQQTHIVYSGAIDCNPQLPRVGNTLFVKQFFDRMHVKKEDSYVTYESSSENESN